MARRRRGYAGKRKSRVRSFRGRSYGRRRVRRGTRRMRTPRPGKIGFRM